MPGVNVTTTVRTGPVGTGTNVAGQAFLVGTAERGSTTEPTLLRSFRDYTTFYGNYQSGNLYSHVKTFFDEGGSRCYVFRTTNYDTPGGQVAATLTLNQGASATLTLTAANVGTWGNGLTATIETSVEDANILAGYFRVKIALDGVQLLTSRDLLDKDDAINFINTSNVKQLVVASDADPAVTNPDAIADASFTGGAETAPTAAHIVSALDGTFDPDPDVTSCFSPTLGVGAVAAPGYTGSTIWNALRDHGVAANRVALCAFTLGDSSATAKSAAAGYYTDSNAQSMAFYWPHIKVPSPNTTELATGQSSVTTATINLSPEAYAAAARSKAVEAAGGPWRPGAGQISEAVNVADLYQDVTPATAQTLDDARINAIRKVNDTIRVYGARSVSSDEANWRYITQQDTINYIKDGIEERMERFLFDVIDGNGVLFGRIRSAITALLKPIAKSNGLYAAFDANGGQIDPGFTVDVSTDNNPTTQLAGGEVTATVGVRVSGVADLINVVITKSNLVDPLV